MATGGKKVMQWERLMFFTASLCFPWDGITQSVQAGCSGDRIPLGGEILRTGPDRPWGPPNLLYYGYRFSFPRVKRPRRGVDQPPPI